MKKLLAIVSLLCLYLLSGGILQNKISDISSEETQCAINTSNDIYSLTPVDYTSISTTNTSILITLRNSQNSNDGNERFVKMASRLLELCLLKESNTLQHISENVTASHLLNYHSLRNRAGYLVYALRKLLIWLKINRMNPYRTSRREGIGLCMPLAHITLSSI